uniref:LIM zinc-binding domain-containing protein n=1 Tax=Periophthalmus magnuspinnatus TaxID=409849 RepID=A0A3B4AR56_9GOBI
MFLFFAAMTEKAVCVGCHRPITDRFLLRVTDGLWHERCVRCTAICECRWEAYISAVFTMWSLCSRLFAVRCGGCSEPLSSSELVMHAGSSVFHLRCFTCSVCSCRLQTGDRCVLRAGQLMCSRDHYHQGLITGYRPTPSSVISRQ